MGKILVFGKVGSGKSTLCNMLYARHPSPEGGFLTSDGVRGQTSAIEKKSGNGWTVVDTIGLGEADEGSAKTEDAREKLKKFLKWVLKELLRWDVETEEGNVETQEATKKLKEFMKKARDEYTYIMYVARAGRFTEEDKVFWELFKKIFKGGESNFVVVYTHTNQKWVEKERKTLENAYGGHQKFIGVDFPPVEEDDDHTSDEERNKKKREINLKKLEDILAGYKFRPVQPDICPMNDTELLQFAATIISEILIFIKKVRHINYLKGHSTKGGDHLLKYGRGGDASPTNVEPIWDIVSSLAQALNSARDQLKTLLHDRSRGNSPLRGGGGPLSKGGNANHFNTYSNSNNTTDCVSSHGGMSPPRSCTPRCYSAPHSRSRRDGNDHGHGHPHNIHRSHARSYYAFGRNTEFKEQMHRGGSGGRVLANYGFRGGGGGGHGGASAGAGGHGHGHGHDAPHPGYGIKLQGGEGACGIRVIPNGKHFSCRRDRGEKGIHLVAKMKNCHMNVDTDGEKFGPTRPVKIHFSTPSKVKLPTPFQHPAEVKRYCVGTQYANLLKEEAHHLRERRIIQQNKILKSNWRHP